MDAQVIDRIRSYVMKHFPSARGRVLREDEHLLASGVLDSLGILDLVTFLESEFDVTVSDEDLVPAHFETLRALADFVGEKSRTGSRHG
jgi:acyl carrier protein